MPGAGRSFPRPARPTAPQLGRTPGAAAQSGFCAGGAAGEQEPGRARVPALSERVWAGEQAHEGEGKIRKERGERYEVEGDGEKYEEEPRVIYSRVHSWESRSLAKLTTAALPAACGCGCARWFLELHQAAAPPLTPAMLALVALALRTQRARGRQFVPTVRGRPLLWARG